MDKRAHLIAKRLIAVSELVRETDPPAPPEDEPDPPPPPVPARAFREEGMRREAHEKGHFLQRTSAGFTCMRCQPAQAGSHSLKYFSKLECRELGSRVPLGTNLSHSMEVKHGLWFCTHCGAWTTSNRIQRGKLFETCGPPTRGGLDAMKCIARDQLPHATLARWPDGTPPIVVPAPKRPAGPRPPRRVTGKHKG